MILYLLYRFGHLLAVVLPSNVSYGIACRIADIWHFLFIRDRKSIVTNLKIITGGALPDDELNAMSRQVFRNFAKYLVDFFRFSLIDEEYIRRFVKVEGRENIDMALARKKGVIALSAHMGNWEFGAFVVSSLGYSLSAVVLTHQNKKINDLFTRQRMLGKMKPIEIGMTLRDSFRALKDNRLLALLGDRDFTKNGFYIDFFGRKTLIPKGPALFAHRLGSAIVPTFMIREKDDSFRLIFDAPIFPDTEQDEEKSIAELARRYSSVIESYVRRYPTQWYMFREVWNGNAKSMRPDTII